MLFILCECMLHNEHSGHKLSTISGGSSIFERAVRKDPFLHDDFCGT